MVSFEAPHRDKISFVILRLETVFTLYCGEIVQSVCHSFSILEVHIVKYDPLTSALVHAAILHSITSRKYSAGIPNVSKQMH